MIEKAMAKRRTPQRYLLTGLLRCGKCDNRLYSSPRATTRRYVCLSGPDHGGCGRLTVVADPLERLMADYVLEVLDSAQLADALAGRSAQDMRTAAVADAIAQDREQLDELAAAYAARQISMREWLAARQAVENRVLDAERRLARATGSEALQGLVGQGDALRSQWSDLNLSRQHAIVSAVLDHAVIGPGSRGAVALDPDRVTPVWKL